MTVLAALGLLLYVVVALTAGPARLHRITADGDAPRMAVAVWLTAVVTVLGCAVAAVALLLVEAAGHWGGPDTLLASCLARLHAVLLGRAGWPAMIVAATALLLAVGSVVVIGVRMARSLHRMRVQTFAHADAVRMVGRAHGDVVIMDAAEPAAYCVVGRPPAIVVTSAALEVLRPAHLAAVVAHERAHLDGRHAYLIAAVRGLAAALPRVRLFTEAAAAIGALLEMCADDAAARHHGRQPLLAGLVALSDAFTLAPRHRLAAAGADVVARARRLSSPQPRFARVRTRLALGGALAAMAAMPTAIAVLSISGALVCFA